MYSTSNEQKCRNDSIRLPSLRDLFPGFLSSRSGVALAYPTTTDCFHQREMASDGSAHPSSRQHLLITHLDAVRRGFAFHRECNRHNFIAFDEAQAEDLLACFKCSVAESQTLSDTKLCEVFSIAAIASTFNLVEIPATVADLFYQAASDHMGTWIYSDHMSAMRCCALLGLSNLLRKATVSLLYFGEKERVVGHAMYVNTNIPQISACQLLTDSGPRYKVEDSTCVSRNTSKLSLYGDPSSFVALGCSRPLEHAPQMISFGCHQRYA